MEALEDQAVSLNRLLPAFAYTATSLVNAVTAFAVLGLAARSLPASQLALLGVWIAAVPVVTIIVSAGGQTLILQDVVGEDTANWRTSGREIVATTTVVSSAGAGIAVLLVLIETPFHVIPLAVATATSALGVGIAAAFTSPLFVLARLENRPLSILGTTLLVQAPVLGAALLALVWTANLKLFLLIATGLATVLPTLRAAHIGFAWQGRVLKRLTTSGSVFILFGLQMSFLQVASRGLTLTLFGPRASIDVTAGMTIASVGVTAYQILYGILEPEYALGRLTKDKLQASAAVGFGVGSIAVLLLAAPLTHLLVGSQATTAAPATACCLISIGWMRFGASVETVPLLRLKRQRAYTTATAIATLVGLASFALPRNIPFAGLPNPAIEFTVGATALTWILLARHDMSARLRLLWPVLALLGAVTVALVGVATYGP